MSIGPKLPTLPDGVKLVNIKEQKIVDGLTFPLILSPIDAFKEKNSDFWNEWVKRNLNIIENLLYKYGAILFRGFPFENPKDFDEFTKAYGYDPFLNVGGNAVRLNVVGNVYTASETTPSYVIPFHHEMAHLNDYPHVLFLYCDIPSRSGGNTPLALSNVIYRKMTEREPAFVRRLAQEGLRYARVAPDGHVESNKYVKSWQETFSTSDRVEAERNAKTLGLDFEWFDDGAMKVMTEILPAIRTDMRNGRMMWFNSAHLYATLKNSEQEVNFLRVSFPNDDDISPEACETMKQVVEEAKVSFKWQHWDVMMIDNRTVLHARDPYDAPPRSVLVGFFKDHQGTHLKPSQSYQGPTWNHLRVTRDPSGTISELPGIHLKPSQSFLSSPTIAIAQSQ